MVAGAIFGFDRNWKSTTLRRLCGGFAGLAAGTLVVYLLGW
jgi:hypothetical protein